MSKINEFFPFYFFHVPTTSVRRPGCFSWPKTGLKYRVQMGKRSCAGQRTDTKMNAAVTLLRCTKCPLCRAACFKFSTTFSFTERSKRFMARAVMTPSIMVNFYNLIKTLSMFLTRRKIVKENG